MKKTARNIVGLAAALAVQVSWTGCQRGEQAESSPKEPPVAAVSLAEAHIEETGALERVVGAVSARTRAQVSARVSGRIVALAARIGQRVAQGELIARLDAGEIGARLEQSSAVLTQAEKELSRYRELLKQGAVTQSEFEGVESRQQTAAAAVKEAAAMLEYTEIHAPFAGVIARKLADVGDLSAPGRPLIELEADGAMQFAADVPEALASRIQLGEKLEVTVDTVGDSLVATVSEIAPSSNPLSRTLLVKLDLPEQAGLRSGQFGRLAVPVKGVANVRVPADAVLQRGQLEIVFVAFDGRARLRLVKTGKRLGGEWEILSGIEAGEKVVANGVADLRDGQRIVAR